MLETILVAYDGSDPAERAFQLALALANPFQATIRVLAVAQRSDPPTAAEMAGLLESATEHFEQAFVDLREQAQAAGLTLATRILVGGPAREIIREATEQKVDLILMGRRSRGRIEEWLSSSVSRHVLRHAPCAVTIVR